MKNIRTILLLSATCLTIMGAETSFASLNGASLLDYTGASATSTSICNTVTLSPKSNQKSHTHLVAESPSPHLSSSNWPQTLSEHRDLSAPISLAVTERIKRRPFASVCFITDAGNCTGLDNDEGWNFDGEDRCQEEGYDCTPCSGSSEAVDICPYSANCHKSCKITCDSAYNKSCDGYDQQGKGDSCNGLYKECCNLCSDYPYTDSNLPTGYVKGSSCNSCSGTKYKASCDTAYQYRCVDDGYDGNANLNGGSGTACDGRYKACNCKSGYNWNASTGTCDISCDTAYKFDCIKSSSTHISGGDGSACNGKYQRCTCTSPYTWSSNACTCPTTYKYACTGTGYSGGSGTACNGKYTKCTCASGYEWKNGTCTKTCDTSYKYTCTNLNETGGSGDSCNNKYKSCTCKSGYIWKNGACIKDCTGCNIGCIYFSDKSCSSIKESGKTPLGVVAYKNGSNMQIIALKKAADETTAVWTTNNAKANSVNLPDYSTETAAAKDIDSCGNTAAIIAAGDSSTFPGVYAAYNYRPSGTPSGQNWCLPAAGVLASIRDNILIINDSIKTAGGTMLGQEGTSLNWYWSSTFQKHSGTLLTYVWTYKTDGSTGEFNSLDKSIADHSSGWESLRTSYIFRSVLDVSSCSSSYKYTCTGTGYSGGYGTACGGKYTKCTCKSGYTWNATSGTCEKDTPTCDSSYKYNCNGPNEASAIGSSCNGLYQKCLCYSGYTWNSIYGGCKKDTPTCDSSYMYTCTYSSSTHISGGSGTPCNGKYKKCNCMAGYNWNDIYGACRQECGSNYQYTCTSNYYNHIIGGSGSSCGGKYTMCRCTSGYTWNSGSGSCEQECDYTYKYTCTYSSSTHISGGKGTACDGKYKACTCMSGYTWEGYYGICQANCDSSYKYTCQYDYPSKISGGKGTACGGKYKECSCWKGYTWDAAAGSCDPQQSCSSHYQYTCTPNSYNHIIGGVAADCNGKYTACKCMSGYEWSYGTCIPTSSGSSSSSGGDNGKVTACFTYQSNDIILFNGQYSSFGGGNRTNWTAGCHTHPNAVLCLDSMAVANTNKNYTIIVYDDQGKEIDRASQKCADHYPADDPVYKGWYNCDFSIGPCVSSSDLTNPSASAKIVVQ